jgi:hypothetical protein
VGKYRDFSKPVFGIGTASETGTTGITDKQIYFMILLT